MTILAYGSNTVGLLFCLQECVTEHKKSPLPEQEEGIAVCCLVLFFVGLVH